MEHMLACLCAHRLLCADVIILQQQFESCSAHLATLFWLALCAAIGFNVETVTYKNIKFQVWDLVSGALILLLRRGLANVLPPGNQQAQARPVLGSSVDPSS